MPRGRKTALAVTLTPDDRATFQAWQRSTTIHAGLARRGRMVLLYAEGKTLTEIGYMVGLNRRFVYKWLRRYAAQGLAGLRDDNANRGKRKQGAPDAA